MAKLTPQQIAEKQIKRAQAATQDYINGVNAVTVSPTALAAKAVNKYLAGVQAAVDNNTFVNQLNAVSLQSWQATTADKGGKRWASGIQSAQDKIIAFQTAYGPVRDRVQQMVRQMPSDTFEQRMARSVAMATGLHQNPYKRGKSRP